MIIDKRAANKALFRKWWAGHVDCLDGLVWEMSLLNGTDLFLDGFIFALV